MKDLIIYGKGGLGKEVLSIVKTINGQKKTWNFLGFIDDDEIKGDILGGFDYLTSISKKIYVVLAFGNPLIKNSLADRIEALKFVKFASLIHPAALLQEKSTIKIGKGAIIGAGCILTTDIEIGKHVLLNLNSTVGHDTSIGPYSSIMPGVNIAGEVHIDRNVFIGSGANILNRLHIGMNSKVGAGAVVTKDVSNDITVVGIPAKPVK